MATATQVSELPLQTAELRVQVLPQLDNVLHRGAVAPAQLQDNRHELLEGELLLRGLLRALIVVGLEDLVHKVDEADHVNADLVQDLRGLLVLQKRDEFVLGDHLVVITVSAGDRHNLMDFLLHVCQRQLLCLCVCHCRHNFADDTNQHIHDRKGGHKHKDVENAHEDKALVLQWLHQKAQAVHERTVQQELVHGRGDITEGGLTRCLRAELGEGNAKDVNYDQQQDESEHHRAQGRHDCLRHDQQLWHCPQEPRHSRHPGESQESRHAQDRGIAKTCTVALARDDENCGHDPCLQYHGEH
mmetsp:Transcript_94768/g.263580  ORF Transcript_94768/g.263580 Transcript_94768/m.263580 type:complete len:301 (-) Transcript_94768:578-1480(-)